MLAGEVRSEIAEKFEAFLREQGMQKGDNGRLPHGTFQRFAKRLPVGPPKARIL